MVVDDGTDDPAEWGIDASPYSCPGQSTLIPWLMFARLSCRYQELLMGTFGNPSSLTVHSLLEADWRRWRGKWLLRAGECDMAERQVLIFSRERIR